MQVENWHILVPKFMSIKLSTCCCCTCFACSRSAAVFNPAAEGTSKA